MVNFRGNPNFDSKLIYLISYVVSLVYKPKRTAFVWFTLATQYTLVSLQHCLALNIYKYYPVAISRFSAALYFASSMLYYLFILLLLLFPTFTMHYMSRVCDTVASPISPSYTMETSVWIWTRFLGLNVPSSLLLALLCFNKIPVRCGNATTSSTCCVGWSGCCWWWCCCCWCCSG